MVSSRLLTHGVIQGSCNDYTMQFYDTAYSQYCVYRVSMLYVQSVECSVRIVHCVISHCNSQRFSCPNLQIAID